MSLIDNPHLIGNSETYVIDEKTDKLVKIVHANKGNRYAAKPLRKRVELKIPLTDYEEFERLAGGGSRLLSKWLLQAAKEKADREQNLKS